MPESKQAPTQSGSALEPLLGRNRSDPYFEEYVRGLSGSRSVTKYATLDYIGYEQSGICFGSEKGKGVLASIFLYSEGKDDHQGFKGETPHNIAFSWSRDDVRAFLGPPVKSSDGGFYELLKTYYNVWDVYKWNDILLNITYAFDCQSVELLTLMPSSEPE